MKLAFVFLLIAAITATKRPRCPNASACGNFCESENDEVLCEKGICRCQGHGNTFSAIKRNCTRGKVINELSNSKRGICERACYSAYKKESNVYPYKCPGIKYCWCSNF